MKLRTLFAQKLREVKWFKKETKKLFHHGLGRVLLLNSTDRGSQNYHGRAMQEVESLQYWANGTYQQAVQELWLGVHDFA